MKKNLISIGILALLIVNLVLTGIMMFSVMSTNKKTAALISDIATAINLELEPEKEQSEEAPTISIADVETYTISDMTIPLKRGTVVKEDGSTVTDTKDHFAMISVALSMNNKHVDYEAYGATLETKVDLIKGQINNVVSQYTIDEAKSNSQQICQEILAKIQSLYNSDFIFDVTFSSALYQ